ncbi:MAG: SRPBCC family protein [Planctomycetes bacterium]|nr:SRPBCC family protein [Planctomycetota bacterium]
MLKTLIFVLSTVLVLFLVIGFFLPNDYRVESSVVIAAERQKVYDVVSDLETWPDWTTWSREFDPKCKWTFEGARTGAGAVMRWEGDPERLRTGELRLVGAAVDRGVDYELLFSDKNFRTTGSIAFADDPQGVRVTWTNEGELGSKPIGGWVKVLIGSMLDRTMSGDFKTSLDRLKVRVEGKPTDAPADPATPAAGSSSPTEPSATDTSGSSSPSPEKQ